MTIAALTFVIFLGSLVAGFLGALTGLGGGVVIVPLLTLGFGTDIRYAIGASLVSVIATSSGAAAAYVREGYSNIRIGMFLEIATCMGALGGAFLASVLSTKVIGAVFGVMLLYSAYVSRNPRVESLGDAQPPDRLTKLLKMDGSYPTPEGPVFYRVQRVPQGFGLMTIAGVLSGLLGIGSGALKVIAMDQAMGLPFKVSTTTSNFMIGVTAAASVGFYLRSGYIDPTLAMPVVLGVAGGAFLGARLLQRIAVPLARRIFAVLIVALGIEMIYQAFTGRIA